MGRSSRFGLIDVQRPALGRPATRLRDFARAAGSLEPLELCSGQAYCMRSLVILRLNLPLIDDGLFLIERDWPRIAAELARSGIGGKLPFTAVVRANMMSAYTLLDELLAQRIEPFSQAGTAHVLELNNRVLYGTDHALMAEFKTAIAATADRFQTHLPPISSWYRKHAARGDHPYKLAAEMYVSILGRPQLFFEGNHRTGSLVASWIDLYAGYPPFVLSVDNAVPYFAPSAEIKWFADKSSWRGRRRLPKYRKSFRVFWEQHVDDNYVIRRGV